MTSDVPTRARVSRADVDALAEIVLDRVRDAREPHGAHDARAWDVFAGALEGANTRLTISLRYRNRITERLESIGYQGTMLQWCRGKTISDLEAFLATLGSSIEARTEIEEIEHDDDD